MSAQILSTVSSLDKYDGDDLLNTFLRYGLFIGAIFQLVCVGSSILLPGCGENSNSDGDENEDAKHNESNLPNMRRLHKLRKLDKKKRR